MRRVFIATCFYLAALFVICGQSTDTLVIVSGKMLKAQDSTIISGNILYEKLPYYDDMGMASVSTDGSFQLYLVKGETYNLSVTKPGFRKYENKLDVNGDEQMNIYVEEDVIELRKLENLNFARASDEIRPSSYQELDGLADWLIENASIVIQLEGHTDIDGAAEANLRLSQARVESVKNYLLDKGIKKNRVFTKAFGETQPISTERTDEARALNRRVEVRVIRR